jgi:hypothetical protein
MGGGRLKRACMAPRSMAPCMASRSMAPCTLPRHRHGGRAMQLYLGANDYGAMRRVHFLKSFRQEHIWENLSQKGLKKQKRRPPGHHARSRALRELCHGYGYGYDVAADFLDMSWNGVSYRLITVYLWRCSAETFRLGEPTCRGDRWACSSKVLEYQGHGHKPTLSSDLPATAPDNGSRSSWHFSTRASCECRVSSEAETSALW